MRKQLENTSYSFVLTAFSIILIPDVLCDNGLMLIRQKNKTEWAANFCIDYNPLFHELPGNLDLVLPRKLIDLSDKYGCNSSDYHEADVNQSVVIVARGNCSFSEKAYIAQDVGASAIVIASTGLLTPGVTNESIDYQKIVIPVATILWGNVQNIKDIGPDQITVLYNPYLKSKFNLNLIVIFFIAFTCILIGGYWAGITKHRKFKRMQHRFDKEHPSSETDLSNDSDSSIKDENESVDVSLLVIVIFVILVCAFLLLLYFFYDYLVYVVIALFCMASTFSLHGCLIPIWHKVCCLQARLPANSLPFLRSRPQYKNLILLALCAAVAIFWAIQRHASYAWIIQDILGYTFCINIMKTVNFPNLKICTVMLVLLFFYDIFFVFITPLLTSNGDSIMVKVATGGDSKTHEQLPMVFKVPRLAIGLASDCQLQDSLLGFGDIIIPGLLVCHNHAFDLRVKSKKVYYISTMIAYSVGLIITFVALAVMKVGQPALLYIVPCILITTYVIGLIRGEVKMLWSGIHKSRKPTSVNNMLPSALANSAKTLEDDSSVENENMELLKK